MRSKPLWLTLPLLMLAALGIFAWTNPSYQKAFEAKWYYVTGDYENAYRLASEAYAMDRYNRMALTIVQQTRVARKYLAYIREGEDFLRRIEKMVDGGALGRADRARIAMMCEVMLDRYKTLSATPLTDEALVRRAAKVRDEFATLYRSLSKNSLR
ncbi:MAG: hypothetical protein GXO33_08945 [Epsilonproteobacteria bacterium]|nr:hypothetical protein [Campylobacterota bacterium]